jgi:seryl-tRNA synthetase
MIDIQLLRNDIEFVKQKLLSRGFDLDVSTFQSLENLRKDLQVKTQDLQEKRNSISKEIGLAKSRNENTDLLMKSVNAISDDLKAGESELAELQEKINQFMLNLPNIPHESTPLGKSEADNKIIKTVGEPKKFTFKVKDHVDVGANHGLNFDLGAKLSGARFVVMEGKLAKLHRAIAQYMLDTQTEKHGYKECYTPYLVNSKTLIGTGQFEADLFSLSHNESKLYLIPTSEVTLTNFVRDEVVKQSDLPIKLTAHTPCFRSEAGSYGKDTRGMIRQHQFDKVEMVQIVNPDKSYEALEEMVSHAEFILTSLELPYRLLSLCTGDMGFSAAKTFDLEVWLPSQNTYREISSVSNCEAFQARRLKARFKSEDGKNLFLHTLNGSGLAVGRTLVAVIENYQNEDGSIMIPKVLIPYMGGIEKI